MVKSRWFWWVVGALNGFIFGASVVSARGIDLKSAGITFWIFLTFCFGIILLQVIPAAILLVSFLLAQRRKDG